MPTLPSHSILGPTERAEIERHVAELELLYAQTPATSAEWEGATLIGITKLMLTLPSAQQNEVAAEATGEAFQVALDDVPTWAVEAAIRLWYRGECGENERGQPYDYKWRPSPAEIRRIALAQNWRVYGRLTTLRRLLAAERLIEFSEDHCAKMRARLAGLIEFTD
jgi:hypothetical protein